MSQHEPDQLHISPRVMADLAVVAKRARGELMAQIAEHIGPAADDAEAASLYCCAVSLCLGDLVLRESDRAVPTELINRLWRYCRWPIRLDLGSEQ